MQQVLVYSGWTLDKLQFELQVLVENGMRIVTIVPEGNRYLVVMEKSKKR